MQKIITILIPTRNEEEYITDCLNCVINFEIPEGYKTEIFIIDGNSEDHTVEKVNEFCSICNNVSLINNPLIIQSSALNIGIEKSSGEFILRLDAHSVFPMNYLKLLHETSIRTGADNVGGIINTLPGNDSFGATLVQALTSHKFGVGNSGFRVGMKEGPADTVPFGFFKKSIFNRIGNFNEKLIRAQDYEFNRRIIKNGGKIWLNPEIQLNYFNQKSFLRFLKKQFFDEAPYNVYMWYIAPYTFAYRHGITGVFSLGVIGGAILSLFSVPIKLAFWSILLLYFLLSVISSVQQAIRYRKLHLIPSLPVAFFLFHFIHGLGMIIGAIKLLTNTAPVQKKII